MSRQRQERVGRLLCALRAQRPVAPDPDTARRFDEATRQFPDLVYRLLRRIIALEHSLRQAQRRLEEPSRSAIAPRRVKH